MKKLLLSLSACGLLFGSTAHISAEATMRVKSAAYAKTAFDILSWPVAMIPVGIAVGKALTPAFTAPEFIPAGLSSMIAFTTGLGLGALAGSVARACYVKLHKLWGFTDAEIEEICKESFEHKLWILAQVGPLLAIIAAYNDAQREREKERKEKEKPHVVVVVK